MKTSTSTKPTKSTTSAPLELWALMVMGVNRDSYLTDLPMIRSMMPAFLQAVADSTIDDADATSYYTIARACYQAELKRSRETQPQDYFSEQQRIKAALESAGLEGDWEMDRLIDYGTDIGFQVGVAFACHMLQQGGRR